MRVSFVNGQVFMWSEYSSIDSATAIGIRIGGLYKLAGIFDLVHSNHVCGPISVSSLGGYLYFTTFIDDFSRNTWIYFLKSNDEVFSKFEEFKAQVENLTNKRIKVFTISNRGEYTSKYFNNFYKSEGIKREFFVPYNLH